MLQETSTEVVPSRTCMVCYRPANCYNFGVLSCDACKMFFKRTIVLNVTYKCKRNNNCFEKSFSCFDTSYCRACRLVQCLKVGMKLSLSTMLDVKNAQDDSVVNLIEGLLYNDTRREKELLANFTFDNPTLEEIVKSKKLAIVARDPSHKMTSSDWCFFGAYTAVKFLLNLPFMKELKPEDKVHLLVQFTSKATLLFSALRTIRAKNDKMIKPDGNDFFTEFLTQWPDFSIHFTHRIRSMLVNRLIELKVTNEELVLIIVVFFCNPALPDLTEHARSILGAQQQTYSSALMKYCLLTYQKNGPSRFAELMSLCTVTNKYFEHVQYLYWIFQFHFGVKYKNLVANVI